MNNCEIIKINDNTWRIENNGVRIFLLAGTEKALLVDSGCTLENVRGIVSSLTDLPVELLNTHADFDHVGGNGEFESFYMHPAEEENLRSTGSTGKIIPVVDGDILDLGGRKLKIIHLPGHTPGSIAVLDIDARVLMSGDPIQENGEVYMFGPQRSMELYVKGLEHLMEHLDEFDEIWPAHVKMPVSPDLVKVLHDGALDVLAGKVKGTPKEVHGQTIVSYDVGPAGFLCAK